MLIKCGECGGEISDQASSCPKCGAPIRINMKNTNDTRNINLVLNRKPKVVQGALLGLIGGFIVIMLATESFPKNFHEFTQILFMASPFILIGAIIGAFIKK